MDFLKNYYNLIINTLCDFYNGYTPLVTSLYEPVEYALEGGKKLRPICTLLATEALGSSIENALPAAIAIEIFHNFTLVHDDVMDQSPIRRGKPTVYHKWDINQAILSGDAMLLLVYQALTKLKSQLIKPAIELLTWAGLRVSEGQQLDMEFESKEIIPLSQYMQMIELKTAVLLGASFKMGALVAQASEEAQEEFYQFGKNLGLAFQIQDDYLDLYADQNIFGKQIGNDIITRKKTFLFIKALELASPSVKQEILKLFNYVSIDNSLKIKAIQNIYDNLGIPQLTLKTIEELYLQSKKHLDNISNLTDSGKEKIWYLAKYLMKRDK